MVAGQIIGSREGLIFFLKCLEEGGLHFSVSTPFGKSFVIAADEVFPYIQDPIAYLAKLTKVTRDQYAAWIQVLSDPRCRAHGKSGNRCQNEIMKAPKHPNELNASSAFYCLHHLQNPSLKDGVSG